jgi:hypothetical protein
MELEMIMRIMLMASLKFAPIAREFGCVAVLTITSLRSIAWHTSVLNYHIG